MSPTELAELQASLKRLLKDLSKAGAPASMKHRVVDIELPISWLRKKRGYE